MSAPGLIIAVLLFVSTFVNAESKQGAVRRRRSLMELSSMVNSVTGREGTDFIGYGQWCGLGGSGTPTDPIDACCESHDLCYDLASREFCDEHELKKVYTVNYQWRTTKEGVATCDDSGDKCKDSICLCDAVIVNCFKNNLQSYNPKNRQKLDIGDLVKQARWLTRG